jgi:pimeloyl-ACP methyl ester carboxylesterase
MKNSLEERLRSREQGWVQWLAVSRQVIAVEMQGHGHAMDTDGHSFGGASAIRASIQHPHKVRRLAVISWSHARSAWYPKAREGMSQISASMASVMMPRLTAQLSQQWPEPRRFPQGDRRILRAPGCSATATTIS